MGPVNTAWSCPVCGSDSCRPAFRTPPRPRTRSSPSPCGRRRRTSAGRSAKSCVAHVAATAPSEQRRRAATSSGPMRTSKTGSRSSRRRGSGPPHDATSPSSRRLSVPSVGDSSTSVVGPGPCSVPRPSWAGRPRASTLRRGRSSAPSSVATTPAREHSATTRWGQTRRSRSSPAATCSSTSSILPPRWPRSSHCSNRMACCSRPCPTAEVCSPVPWDVAGGRSSPCTSSTSPAALSARSSRRAGSRSSSMRSHPKVFTRRYYANRLGEFVPVVGPLLARGVARTRHASRPFAPDFHDRVAVIARRL